MKKLKRQVFGLTGIGVTLGAGATIESKLGAGTTVSSTTAGALSPIGTVIGGTAAIRMLRKLKKKLK